MKRAKRPNALVSFVVISWILGFGDNVSDQPLSFQRKKLWQPSNSPILNLGYSVFCDFLAIGKTLLIPLSVFKVSIPSTKKSVIHIK